MTTHDQPYGNYLPQKLPPAPPGLLPDYRPSYQPSAYPYEIRHLASTHPITSVISTFTVEGWHRWPDAPDSRDYLRARHRHVFHCRVEVQVTHGDREIECHTLADRCRSSLVALGGGFGDFDTMSCEQIAHYLFEVLAQRHPQRKLSVEVLEDGECGAKIATP